MGQKISTYLHKNEPALLSSVATDACVHLFAQFLKEPENKGKVPILVLPHGDHLHEATQFLEFLKPSDWDILNFPNWDCLPYDRISPSKENAAQRLNSLCALSGENKKNVCIVTTVAALIQRLPPPTILQNRTLELSVGQTIDVSNVTQFLQSNGYERSEVVTLAGHYAVRGGLIDVFPPGVAHPVRLDFFGDELETLKQFDVETQRTLENQPSLRLLPSTEVFITQTTQEEFRKRYRQAFGIEATKDPLYEAVSEKRFFPGQEHWLPYFYPRMVDFLTYASNAVLLLPESIQQVVDRQLDQITDHFQSRSNLQKGSDGSTYRPINPQDLYMDWKELLGRLQDVPQIYYTPLKNPKGMEWGYAPSVIFESTTKINVLKKLGAEKRVIVTGRSEGHLDHIKNYLQDHEITNVSRISHVFDIKKKNGFFLVQCPLIQGFQTDEMLFISGDEVLGRTLQATPSKRKKVSSLFEIVNFQLGELLVHRDYGVALYSGLKNIKAGGAAHDCIQLEYDRGDILYVPVENMELLSFYGSAGDRPSLDRLGGGNWELKKAKAKKRIQDIAKKLVELAARRQEKESPAFVLDKALYHEFCRAFPYVETEDQAQAIQEIIHDLAQEKPMDRLLCGDVGFGKTEVALRAAFAAVQAGYQVALVCPTTLLCGQHLQTFKRRFDPFHMRVEGLSRLQTSSKSQKIYTALEEGSIDIIVGTHALLSPKIKFKNLGLVIVDEEQHFGVKQKEHLKNLVEEVHVLSMSATPIPRSLQMAVSGIRELSIIATPPVDRLAVHTFVSPYDDITVREAILREFHRGGQVFYVCPRVADLERVFDQLSKLVPEVKMAIGHGGMLPEQLARTMQGFEDHAFDVLLATNIVESGLDIPNANTLIVHRSDLFGLSQLYQLRGRVGRSKARGYAYFTFTPDKLLTDNALKRLEVIQSLEGLGGGFSLASRDMDIRGMGNLVGEEQSGHVKEVGISLYHHMLEEAILEHKQGVPQKLEKTWTPQIHVGLDVLIPEAYIWDLNLRLSFYRRLSELEMREEADDLMDEMMDRFGPLPQEILNLFHVVHMKNLCKKLHIHKIEVGPKGVLVSFFEDQCPYVQVLLDFMSLHGGSLRLRPDHKLVILKAWKNPQDQLKGLTDILRELRALCKSTIDTPNPHL